MFKIALSKLILPETWDRTPEPEEEYLGGGHVLGGLLGIPAGYGAKKLWQSGRKLPALALGALGAAGIGNMLIQGITVAGKNDDKWHEWGKIEDARARPYEQQILDVVNHPGKYTAEDMNAILSNPHLTKILDESWDLDPEQDLDKLYTIAESKNARIPIGHLLERIKEYKMGREDLEDRLDLQDRINDDLYWRTGSYR